MTSADHRPMVAPAASLQCFMAGVYLSHKTSRGRPVKTNLGAGFFYAYLIVWSLYYPLPAGSLNFTAGRGGWRGRQGPRVTVTATGGFFTFWGLRLVRPRGFSPAGSGAGPCVGRGGVYQGVVFCLVGWERIN